MHSIQPRSLTNAELINYINLQLATNAPVPSNWTQELVNRFENKLYGKTTTPYATN